MIELGSFVMFNLLSFGFMGYGYNKQLPLSGILLIFSMVLFLGLGFYMLIEDDIGITTTQTDGTDTWITTKVFMADQETYYLIWIYFGMSVLSFVAFMFTRGIM
jgi:hypothetical protein